MNPEILALFIAGLVASPFIQFIKERLGWSGWKAQWLAWGLCIGIAFISLFLTKQLAGIPWPSEPISLTAQIGLAITAIVGLANIIYKAKFDQPTS